LTLEVVRDTKKPFSMAVRLALPTLLAILLMGAGEGRLAD
jgi:hypothetical protein